MLIGICGKSGSGKSTLAKQLLEIYPNAIHLDIDKIGHKALLNENVQKELINSFGNGILENEKVNRKKLGDIVFNSRNEMSKLSEITWNYMQEEIDKIISNNKDKIIILDWLLLPKTKYFNMCNIRILIDVDYEIRKKRCMLRDNITEESFDLREKASINYNSDDFDFVIKDIDKEFVRKMEMRL